MAETVSVIIPAYNAAAYVGRAIESALAQTHPPLEILVVDDGSKDHTAEVVAAYEPHARLIRKPNGGPASARNLGAKLAQGRWLALLDADDWWQADKLDVQLDMARSPDVGVIHCLPEHRSEAVPAQLTFADLWVKNWIVNSSVLVRRDVFEALGGFNEARELISVEDYNFWLRVAASQWKIITCQRKLVHYTRGIGISAQSERFRNASLYNIASLEQQLNLAPDMVRRRRNEIVLQFARQALYERDLPTARKLLREAWAGGKSPSILLYSLLAQLPEPVLNIKRHAAGLRGSAPQPAADAATRPATPATPVWPQAAATTASQQDITRIVAHWDRPLLLTTVDAEEEFNWGRPFSRATTSVAAMRSQHLAHRVFERYGVVPAYMVDYPVASKPEGREPLLDLLQAGQCSIGAQLHTWVTPPFVERLSARNSHQSNLPAELELAKMQVLTAEIENAFGVRPRVFRAGRYGAGPNTAGILRQLGYQVDTSVLPCWSFRNGGGPDYRRNTAWPHWIGEGRDLLELPISAALVGRAAGLSARLTAPVFSRASERLSIPSALGRLGLLERIKLTPEGITVEEAKRLVRHMHGQGHRVFVLTYHSPSLEIGNTPYVQTQADLDRLLGWLDAFLEFFAGEMGGRASTWPEIHQMIKNA